MSDERTKQIKRYDIDNSEGKCGGEYEFCDPTVYESDDGEWVKWEDVRRLIEQGRPRVSRGWINDLVMEYSYGDTLEMLREEFIAVLREAGVEVSDEG